MSQNLTKYRTYFTIDTTLGIESKLYIKSPGQFITSIETGEGNAYINYDYDYTVIEYNYINSGIHNGYFDSEYEISHLEISGPVSNITQIPVSIKQLYLYKSNLTQLDLTGLVNLQSLVINDSPLNTFLGKEDCSSLIHLDITNCNFTKVQDFHFLNFVSITHSCYLSISGNPISTIDISNESNNHIYSLENIEVLNAGTCSLLSFSNVGQWVINMPATHPNLSLSIPYKVYKNSSHYDSGNLIIKEDYYNQKINGLGEFTDNNYYIPNVFNFEFTIDVIGSISELINTNSTIGVDYSFMTFSSTDITSQDIQIHLESVGDSFDIYFSIPYTYNNISSRLTDLDLSNNSLDSLNLSTFQSLNVLKINNCYLDNLLGVDNIKELYASYNKFESLPQISNLTKLIIDNNNIYSISDIPLTLNYLDVSFNTNLSNLNLSRLSLIHLDISHTKLSSSLQNGYHDFMSELGIMISLEYFNGDYSPITVDGHIIKNIINSNKSLRIFKASHSDIYGTIDKINTHSEIVELDISYSKVSEFIFDNGKFRNLEILNLSNSLINNIHFGEGNITFSKLITLDLSHNMIPNWTQSTTNGDNVNSFPLLQNLILNNNPISIFNLRTSANKGSLVNLDLENCTEVTEINIGHLGGPLSIQNVNLKLNTPKDRTVIFYFENVLDLNSFILSNTKVVNKQVNINGIVYETNRDIFYS